MVWIPYPHGLGNSSSPCCCGNALQFVIYIVVFNSRKTFCFSLGKNFLNTSQTDVVVGGGFKKGATSKDIKH